MERFNLFVLHGGPHKAEVDGNALWEYRDDLRCLFALLTADGPLGGCVVWYGFHAQQILNKRQFLFRVVVQKAKVTHPSKSAWQHMGQQLPDKVLAV